MRYTIRHFDLPLLTFEANMDSADTDLHIIKVYEENRSFLPLNLTVSEDGVERWLRHRTIPKNRAYVDALLSKVGLSLNRPLGIIAANKGLSLNDCFWVDAEGSGDTFEKVNLYDNRFSQVLAAIAFTGLAAVSSSAFAALYSAFGKYDVVHIHAEGPAFFAWLPKMFGKRVVVTVHGIDWKREKWQSGLGSKFIHQGEKNAAKYADEVIVLSKGVQDYFKETYGRKTHFIPNGVNRPQIREASLITDKFGLKKDSYILFLGRLVPEKGIRYLVEAFKNVKTDKKLVIAGGSSDTDSFMEELKELAKGDDQILFTGFVQGAMLDELYSNAYIYTLPSDLEGMPLSLLEAMSYGNCCLVSDIPECAEVVEDKALIFKKSDVEDLREKLQDACDHPEMVMKMKNQAADFICEKYNWDEVVKETMKLYRRK